MGTFPRMDQTCQPAKRLGMLIPWSVTAKLNIGFNRSGPLHLRSTLALRLS